MRAWMVAGVLLAGVSGAGLAQDRGAQDPGARYRAAKDPGAGAPVSYDVRFDNAAHHEARIAATWRQVPAGPLRVQMSRSSPGRYALHEFAKNVYSVSAVDGAGRPLTVIRTDPYGWTVAGHDGTVTVTYTLFGDRGDGTYAQIDRSHAHLNMPASMMWATGYDARPIRVTFHSPDPKWKVATQLPASAEPGTYWAPDLQYLMDSPTELSDFALREWKVGDQTIRLAVHHLGSDADVDVFAGKVKRTIEQHFKVFGGAPRYDYGSYTFIADYLPWASRDGMEHRNSTIISGTAQLAATGFAPQLGTASHEFTHSWNVERIRPAELEPFDFTRANPTPSLWVAEGFTQYYGPLLIRRAGEQDVDAYLAELGRTLSAVVNAPARGFGGPQEMSLRAPFVDAAQSIDPVNPNIFVSYYAYGAALAAAIDLGLRGRPGGKSLDDVMRALWRTHGVTEVPYRPDDVRAALATASGDPAFADAFWEASVEGSALPDYAPLLARAGLTLRPARGERGWLGADRAAVADGAVVLADPPVPGSPLYAAGVERGDTLVSLGGVAIADVPGWRTATAALKPGTPVELVVCQLGTERRMTVTPVPDPALEIVRDEAIGGKLTSRQRAFRTAWLGAGS